MTEKAKVVRRREVLVVVTDERLEETQRRHEIGLTKLLAAKHPEKAAQALRELGWKVVDRGGE